VAGKTSTTNFRKQASLEVNREKLQARLKVRGVSSGKKS